LSQEVHAPSWLEQWRSLHTHISTVQRKYTTGEELLRLSDAGNGGRYLLATESPWQDGRVFALAQVLDRVVQVLLGLAERAIPLVAIPFRAT